MRNHKHAITTKPERPGSGNATSTERRDPNNNGDQIGIRVRRLLFFWISLGVFLLTHVIVVPAYCWVLTLPKVGEAAGATKIFFIFNLCMLDIFGIVVSLVFSAFAIPYFKGAIVLFIVEMIALGYILVFFVGFEQGVLLLPVPGL